MKRLLPLTLLLAGCTIPSSYIKLDRRLHDTLAPEYIAYVNSDSTLTLSDKQRRARLLTSWDARISEMEKEFGE